MMPQICSRDWKKFNPKNLKSIKMKKSVIVMLSMFVMGVGSFAAQHGMKKGGEVPVSVKNAFKKEYPQVKKVKWDEEHGKFEAEFKLNN